MKKEREGHSRNVTIIGENIQSTGDITAIDDIRIEGELIGNIVSEGKVIIGKKGFVKGSIKANEIIILGKAEGEFEAITRFDLKRSGSVSGALLSKTIAVEEHAVFNCQCAHSLSTSDERLKRNEPTIDPEIEALLSKSHSFKKEKSKPLYNPINKEKLTKPNLTVIQKSEKPVYQEINEKPAQKSEKPVYQEINEKPVQKSENSAHQKNKNSHKTERLNNPFLASTFKKELFKTN